MIDKRFPKWDVDVEKGTIYSLYWKKNVGYASNSGYITVTPPKGYKHSGLHQYIWMVANGCDIPIGYEIHHIDGNRHNNSISNLKLVDISKHRSEHHKGIKQSKDTKTKISKGNKGKKLTEETKHKISESHKGKTSPFKGKISPNRVKVIQYGLDGTLIKVWDCISECSSYNFHRSNIIGCCNGKYKTHKGYIWKYYSEQKDV